MSGLRTPATDRRVRPSPTTAVRAGLASDPTWGAVMPPLFLSSNFTFAAPGQPRRYDYTRSGNPTRDLAAEAIADLEGGEGAVLTSSGMSAVALVTRLLGVGDLLVAPHDGYGGCHRLFSAEHRAGRFTVRFVDQGRDESLDEVRSLRPAMIWLETPSNPLLQVVDIERWAELAREVGALCVVDNTFLSPAGQRPLALGADLVVHSTTKLLNGHSDVVGGAVVARSAEHLEDLSWWANCLGIAGAPFDAYLTLRGIRTLFARVAVHEANALALVDRLEAHPAVQRLFHPSLDAHAGHSIARRQQALWGSLLSFELRGGLPAVEAFVDGLEYFTLAESLGGVESLVAHPATMTHASMDDEARRVAGIGDGLLRISVGIEAESDLLVDLDRALARAEEVACPTV